MKLSSEKHAFLLARRAISKEPHLKKVNSRALLARSFNKALNSKTLTKQSVGLVGAFGIFTILAQAISWGKIFNDPNAGLSFKVLPSAEKICHEDQGEKFVFSGSKRQEEPNLETWVVFGVNVSLQNALLGARILAQKTNQPVKLIHNGSVNIFIDYLRAVLARLHFWPLGRGNEPSIQAIKNQIRSFLASNEANQQGKKLHLIGHSAGASSIYCALHDLLRESPYFKGLLQEKLSVEFWGSPEYTPDMMNLTKICSIKIVNRSHDYIVDAFQEPLIGGLALPLAVFRVISDLQQFGNQHRAILYLKDYKI
jgi:hypothetical protein